MIYKMQEILFNIMYPHHPSVSANYKAFALLVGCLLAVFYLEFITPEGLSLGPIFAIIVLFAGLLDDKHISLCIICIAALLFADSFLFDSPSVSAVYVFYNFFIAFAAYASIAKCSSIGAGAMGAFSKLIIKQENENYALKGRVRRLKAQLAEMRRLSKVDTE